MGLEILGPFMSAKLQRDGHATGANYQTWTPTSTAKCKFIRVKGEKPHLVHVRREPDFLQWEE